jgi:hypothetical protein
VDLIFAGVLKDVMLMIMPYVIAVSTVSSAGLPFKTDMIYRKVMLLSNARSSVAIENWAVC